MTPPYYYQQQTATGTENSYKACLSGYFYNGTVPSITFNETVKSILPSGRELVEDGMGQLTESLANPDEVFNLRNPADGAVTGTMTYMQLYLGLYSLYLHAAEKRDAAPPPPFP